LSKIAQPELIEQLVKETKGMGFGHLRELIAGHFALGNPLETVMAQLKRRPLTESQELSSEERSARIAEIKKKLKVLGKRFKNASGEGDSRNTHLAQRELYYELNKLRDQDERSESTIAQKSVIDQLCS
jgi:hypothetical protein